LAVGFKKERMERVQSTATQKKENETQKDAENNAGRKKNSSKNIVKDVRRKQSIKKPQKGGEGKTVCPKGQRKGEPT